MAITLNSLLERVDPRVEDSVKKARDSARAAIREALRSECRLSLRGSDDADYRISHAQVPISIEPGCPRSLTSMAFPETLDLVVKLMQFRDAISTTARSIGNLPEVNRLLRSHPSGTTLELADENQLARIKDWTARLLELLDTQDPVKLILNVDDDVLGCYWYDPSISDPLASNGARIELYWCVIGLVSRFMGCSVEDLSVVVMTHELAHAYTQLGADIDGRRWASQDFSRADVGLKEGLAQYFTARVLDRLTKRFPGAKSAYQTLLDKQPEIYRLHLPWIEDGVSPEAVRRAMLEIRRSGGKTLAEFHDRLHKAHTDFSTHREQ